MKPGSRRPTNRRIANATGLVAFSVTLAVLGLTGVAVALLDPGPTGGPGPGLAIAILSGAALLVGAAARGLALVVLARIRPDGI